MVVITSILNCTLASNKLFLMLCGQTNFYLIIGAPKANELCLCALILGTLRNEAGSKEDGSWRNIISRLVFPF